MNGTVCCQVVKEKSSRDSYHNMKRAIIARLTSKDRSSYTTYRTLGRSVLPLLAVAIPFTTPPTTTDQNNKPNYTSGSFVLETVPEDDQEDDAIDEDEVAETDQELAQDQRPTEYPMDNPLFVSDSFDLEIGEILRDGRGNWNDQRWVGDWNDQRWGWRLE